MSVPDQHSDLVLARMLQDLRLNRKGQIATRADTTDEFAVLIDRVAHSSREYRRPHDANSRSISWHMGPHPARILHVLDSAGAADKESCDQDERNDSSRLHISKN